MNVLIVEGKEDKAFFDYLLKNQPNAANIRVENPPVIEIQQLGGLSLAALTKQIASVINKITKEPIEKLGIIVDLDSPSTGGGFEKRLSEVNESIKNSFQEYFKKLNKTEFEIPQLSTTNEFIKVSIDRDTEIEIACFFIHLDGKGELEDLLRKTKIYPSYHADCLEAWRSCLIKSNSIEKTDKEINKLWLHYYIRYDVCTTIEQENAGQYCNLAYVLNNRGEKLFNFEHDCLQDLKSFLTLFKAEST
jgi:hypothetical protein